MKRCVVLIFIDKFMLTITADLLLPVKYDNANISQQDGVVFKERAPFTQI